MDQDTGIAREAGEPKVPECAEDDIKPQAQNEALEVSHADETEKPDDPWRYSIVRHYEVTSGLTTHHCQYFYLFNSPLKSPISPLLCVSCDVSASYMY